MEFIFGFNIETFYFMSFFVAGSIMVWFLLYKWHKTLNWTLSEDDMGLIGCLAIVVFISWLLVVVIIINYFSSKHDLKEFNKKNI